MNVGTHLSNVHVVGTIGIQVIIFSDFEEMADAGMRCPCGMLSLHVFKAKMRANRYDINNGWLYLHYQRR
jgi:hypothetical protein